MGGCRCSYRNCKSATKLSENLHFFHYPVKHSERCKQWILNANKPNFFNLSEDQLRNKVVCELHFEDRCFTNAQKKRLLHDAIPTLDGDSQELPQPEQIDTYNSFEDVQVLPANADGTIFMVDTDSMQQLPESKVETYILRDGSVVPLYKNSVHSENTQVLYAESALNTMNSLKIQSKNFVNSVPTYFSKTSSEPQQLQVIYNDKNFIASDNLELNILTTARSNSDLTPATPDSMSYSYISEQNSEVPTKVHKNNNKTIKKSNLKKIKNEYIYRCVRRQGKEIASIKKLLQNNLLGKRMSEGSVMNYLKNRLPPTLLSVVELNMRINKGPPAEIKEQEFFMDISSTSPEAYDALRKKYKWNLPDIVEVKQ